MAILILNEWKLPHDLCHCRASILVVALLKIIFITSASVSDYCLLLASYHSQHLKNIRIKFFAELIRKPINLPFLFYFSRDSAIPFLCVCISIHIYLFIVTMISMEFLLIFDLIMRRTISALSFEIVFIYFIFNICCLLTFLFPSCALSHWQRLAAIRLTTFPQLSFK